MIVTYVNIGDQAVYVYTYIHMHVTDWIMEIGPKLIVHLHTMLCAYMPYKQIKIVLI